jgi:nitrous oxidase accessory protein
MMSKQAGMGRRLTRIRRIFADFSSDPRESAKSAFIRVLFLLTLSLTLLSANTAVAVGQDAILPNTLVVSPDGPYTTITAALQAAHAGDTIEVHSGVYGPLLVDKSVQLEGVDWPVIDGRDEGAVVVIAAPDVLFRGFVVRGSGIEPDRNHAGITVTADRVLVANNRLEDVLFGVYVAEGEEVIIRGNDITGKAEYDTGRKGDSIRLWYSPGTIVEENVIHDTRDVVVWYSPGVVIRQNEIRNGRYGVHLMYSDDATISNNQLLNNSVGAYAMYSYNVNVSDNLIRGQRGPSGYAIGFKDAEDVTVANNVLVDNAGGIFLDGTPFSTQGYSHIENNILAFNDVGVTLQPAVKGNIFSHNTFWENISQMGIQGGGTPGRNSWQGNYWSDYTGFDANGDGQGDIPYQADRFLENMMEREPRLRLLLYSPVAQALEFAAQSFPVLRPQPKLLDEAPLTMAGEIPAFALPDNQPSTDLMAAAVGLLLFGLLCGGVAFGRAPKTLMKTNSQSATSQTTTPLQVTAVSKKYGKTPALQDISLTAETGEAIALWGENGAGKTTLLKAILGLIDCQGTITVAGKDARRQGKAARRAIGYVPQETIFYDWSVQATMNFYARLKKADDGERRGSHTAASGRIPQLLDRLGLTPHLHKPVPALSGGLKQRLALAIALLADPPLLLLDEPTASLDAQGRRDYLTLLAELRREGKTIIFASHRLEEVEALANRVLLLRQGQQVAILTPEELREQETYSVTREPYSVNRSPITDHGSRITDNGLPITKEEPHGTDLTLDNCPA